MALPVDSIREKWAHQVMSVTEQRSRICDTHVVNMVRKVS
jgi:hypothetical protein